LKRIRISCVDEKIPEMFEKYISGANLFDSSCSQEAKVIYIENTEKGGGYFLKTSAKGSLCKEACLTEYFHKLGMAAEVAEYISDDKDYLLTTELKGEDLTYEEYLSTPEKMCDIFAKRLRCLHETEYSGCPIKNRTEDYIKTAEQNYLSGNYDKTAFPDSFGYKSAKEAWDVVCTGKDMLKTDTLIHGDYCLPNIIFDDWKFSGFIDLGNAGVSDRHIDLFWGSWTLWFNLKTNRYRDRFFDAYGRDKVDEEMIKIIAAFEVFG